MSKRRTIRWIERSPYLHEARVTTADGGYLYVGYVAIAPGADVWRGYVGRGFVPLGMGPRMVMQRAVEQRVTEILRNGDAAQHLTRRDAGKREEATSDQSTAL